MRMGDREPLSEFKDRFLIASHTMQQVGVPDMPNEVTQALDFLAKLSLAYGEFKSNLTNSVNLGMRQWPLTVEDAYNAAFNYHPLQRQARGQVYFDGKPSVFMELEKQKP